MDIVPVRMGDISKGQEIKLLVDTTSVHMQREEDGPGEAASHGTDDAKDLHVADE